MSDLDRYPPPNNNRLTGLKILSFGSYLAGNTAAMVLAEMGADVVKLESHTQPETLRYPLYPEHPACFEPSGQPTTSLFGGLARSVRSLALDMTVPQSVAVFLRLVAEADAVIENFGGDLMSKWGCGFARLKEVNSSLVMLSISGYGRTGPMGSHRALAATISHHVGMTRAWDGNVALQQFDWVASLQGVVALLAAVDQAARTGQGSYIDLAQAETAAALMTPVYLDVQSFGSGFYPRDNQVPGSLLAGVYECLGHDQWVAVELEDYADWQAICLILDRPDLAMVDEGSTRSHAEDMKFAISLWASERTPMQATLALQASGLAAGPVQTGEDLYRDPQLRARGYIVEIDHPDLGRIEYPTSPHRASKLPGRPVRRAPRLGEHTCHILREWLGLDDAEIDRLHSDGAVWSPQPATSASEPS